LLLSRRADSIEQPGTSESSNDKPDKNCVQHKRLWSAAAARTLVRLQPARSVGRP